MCFDFTGHNVRAIEEWVCEYKYSEGMTQGHSKGRRKGEMHYKDLVKGPFNRPALGYQLHHHRGPGTEGQWLRWWGD